MPWATWWEIVQEKNIERAFIGGNFTSSHLRKQGYMRALQEAGLEIIPEPIFDNEYYDYEDSA